MSGLKRRDRRELASWTWCQSETLMKVAGGFGVRGWRLRRRKVDYARHPDPRLIGELIRRGFQEGA